MDRHGYLIPVFKKSNINKYYEELIFLIFMTDFLIELFFLSTINKKNAKYQ